MKTTTLCILTVLVLPVIYCSYNVWFHPLANFPGPKKAKLSPFWTMKQWLSGDNLWAIKSLHEQYGPVVRIAPNQLSFCSSQSWKDIHGHRSGRKTFVKGSFYEPFPQDIKNIVSVSDTAHHAMMRKSLSHGFSVTALAGQEDRIHDLTNLLIDQIDQRFTETPGDMTKWYNYLTFDVIGDLAFGSSFGCLENGMPHYWIEILFDGIKNMNFMRAFEYSPALRSLARFALSFKLLPRDVYILRAKMTQYTHEKLQKRLADPPPRIDFLTKLISEKQDWTGRSFQELTSQATTLIVAGSETTATALCGITYFLCRNSRAYEKLTHEIRRAVIDEGLRLYPPIAVGLPRVSPGGETVHGHSLPKGIIVSVNTWVAGNVEANFHDASSFIPERWLDPKNQDDKASSQPFLLGSRVCLGRNLALLELRVVLAKILWKFDLQLKDENLDWMKANKNYVFWEKPALPILFHRRQ